MIRVLDCIKRRSLWAFGSNFCKMFPDVLSRRWRSIFNPRLTFGYILISCEGIEWKNRRNVFRFSHSILLCYINHYKNNIYSGWKTRKDVEKLENKFSRFDSLFPAIECTIFTILNRVLTLSRKCLSKLVMHSWNVPRQYVNWKWNVCAKMRGWSPLSHSSQPLKKWNLTLL